MKFHVATSVFASNLDSVPYSYTQRESREVPVWGHIDVLQNQIRRSTIKLTQAFLGLVAAHVTGTGDHAVWMVAVEFTRVVNAAPWLGQCLLSNDIEILRFALHQSTILK